MLRYFIHRLSMASLWALIIVNSATATVWQVGLQHPYQSPKALADSHQQHIFQGKGPLIHDGDIVEIEPGIYTQQEMFWGGYKHGINNLILRGSGGIAHLIAPEQGLANNKGIFIITGKNTLIENIEFSGAKNQSEYNFFQYGNGAGIRTEPGIEKLTLRHCYFHHNENGILTANDPSVELLIEYSQFANNGAGDGYSHNIYVGYARKFTLRYSNIHHAKIGHNIKSRAAQNNILFNRIADGDNGTSSYAIDLPNGGLAHIMGNMIQQGKMTENPQIILAYGLLQAKKGVSALYQFKHVTIAHNIFINEQGSPDFIHLKGKPTTDIFNNIFQGRGQPVTSGD